jgi:biopolymer transport protein ExbB/TolQ
MHFTPTELWFAMGPVGRAVIVLLALMSALSLAVAIERVLKLGRVARESTAFLATWRRALASGGVAGAAGEATRFPRSYVAHLVAECTKAATAADRGTVLEILDRTARRVIIASRVDARQGLGVLATVGSTAPFVGLFGTVVGIVSAFHMMGVSGQGGLGTVSAGIAEALVATALGILVAIPALWLFNHLTQRIQRLVAELECVAEELAVALLGEADRGEARPRQVVGR